MFKFFTKKNKIDAEWRKVSELKPGMQIAVPKDGVLETHQAGKIDARRPVADVAFSESGPISPYTDIIWDEIASIEEDGEEQVWDIEVEGTHNFVGNNIFAHNTAIFGAGEGGTPTTTTIRGAAATGANIAGANLTLDASNGTGTGGSGALIFRTAPTAASSSTANTLAEVMRITPAGNVGIGTTTPWAQLALNPMAGQASNQFVIGSSTATSLVVNNTGFVGIATTTPQARFAVQTLAGDLVGFAVGSSTKSLLSVSTEGFGTTTLRGLNIVGQATSTSNVGSNITTGCYAISGTCVGGSSFTNTLANGGTATTTFYNGGIVFSDSTKLTQSAVASNFFWDETNNRLGLGTSTPFAKLSVNSIAGEPAFVVGSSTATSFIVDKNGNVGIGTASPSNKLHVAGDVTVGNGASADQPAIYNSVTNGALELQGSSARFGGAYIVLDGASNSGSPGYLLATHGNYNAAGPASFFKIRYANNGAITDQVVVNSSGNVGIGTSTPSWLLNPFSSTASQLALSAGAGVAQWAFRNAGGNLYFATTTTDGTATTSLSALTILNNGNIGVGTSSPLAIFTVAGANANALRVDNGSGTNILTVDSSSATQAGIDITAATGQTANLLNFYSSGGTLLSFFTVAGGFQQNISSTTAVRIQNGSATDVFVVNSTAGSVGVGTTTPWRTFSVTGSMALTAPTNSNTGDYLCWNTTTFEVEQHATACSLSSIRWKENIREINYGLEEILKLHPILYDLKPQYGTAKDQPGFIAEEAFLVVPNLVSLDKEGPTGFDYPKLTAVLTKAIQELNLKVDLLASTTASSTPQNQSFVTGFFKNIFARVTIWLADAANGIGDFFANRVRTKELCVRDDNGSETCISKVQLDALLGNAVSSGNTTSAVSVPSPIPNNSTSSTTTTATTTTTTVTGNTASTTPETVGVGGNKEEVVPVIEPEPSATSVASTPEEVPPAGGEPSTSPTDTSVPVTP